MKNESGREYTSRDCEHEPIQIPGSIQPQGILFALRHPDLTILQVSANVYDILGLRPEELLHQSLEKIMDVAPVQKAGRRIGERTPRLLNPLPVGIKVGDSLVNFDGILHRSGRNLILELEKHVPDTSGYGGFGGFYEAIREVITKIMLSDSLGEVFEITCDELRKLTGFSRVLIYKFDEDWNGKVIAESNDDKFPSLMHHRFPASDIPKQARDLYTTNWLRIIPDVDYVSSPLVPQNNPLTDRPLDLSNSVLRSVSPIHIEYMKNLGQGASMSISLLKGRKLWGLISCHHRDAHFLKYENRVASEFIGQMVSSQIVAREDAGEQDHRLQLKSIYDELLRSGTLYNELAPSLCASPGQLLGLTDSQGAMVYINDEIHLVGTTPDERSCRDILRWLSNLRDPSFFTAALGKEAPQFERLKDVASGMLAISIDERFRSAIVWFRPQQKQSIPWAGNPYESKFRDDDGGFHPRRSFDTWLEEVGGSALAWKKAELEVASELRIAVAGLALREGARPYLDDATGEFRSSLAKSLVASENNRSFRETSSGSRFDARRMDSSSVDCRLLMEGFTDFAILLIGLDGKIKNWSLGATRLTGYEQSNALGKSLDIFMSYEDAQKDKQGAVLSYVKQHGKYEEELWVYRADLTSFWGKISLANVYGSDSEVVGISLVIRDITQEKASEEELKAAKFAAEAANQAKTAFLANISHEIRTPLGAVLGFAELMTKVGKSDDDRKVLFSRVSKNGEQLTTLINDLLDIAKAEAGKVEIEKLDIDFPTFISDFHNSLSIKAVEKAIRLSIEIDGELPIKIRSDPTRLRQVLMNLVGNAIKFTPTGGAVTVRISFPVHEPAGLLNFRVVDSGLGMSKEQAGKLFQAFVQADASTTRNYGGSGLGLFVSHRLAKSLGGNLLIEKTEPGKGSTFLATIDPGNVLGTPSFTSFRQANAVIPDYAGDRTSLLNSKVLVVDDVKDNRDIIRQFLEAAGATVDTANDGREGIDKALQETYDLILMDLQMPVLDGVGALRELRKSKVGVPVVAITAHAMTEHRETAHKAGFDDFISKPINSQALVQLVSLRKRKSS